MRRDDPLERFLRHADAFGLIPGIFDGVVQDGDRFGFLIIEEVRHVLHVLEIRPPVR